MRKILVGIILYNPEISRLEENVSAIINQSEKVLLIDNASVNIKEIVQFSELYENVELIKNNSNLGIARAINQVLEYSLEHGYEWFLTLDQDSVCSPDIMKYYEKYLEYENVAQLTCNIIDRKTGSLTSHNNSSEFSECNGCITSGALNNTKALFSVGGGYRRIIH